MRACSVCGGTKLNTIWHQPKWRPSINRLQLDSICFACAAWAARIMGLIA